MENGQNFSEPQKIRLALGHPLHRPTRFDGILSAIDFAVAAD